MKVTRLGPPIPILSSGLGGNAGSRIPAGGNDLQVLTSNGSNGRYWGENVRRITSNGSNILVSPDVNFVSGSNIFFAVASNTLTIHGQAGGGGGVTALTANGSNSLAGAINLQAGVGIALGVSGSTITITNTLPESGGGGGGGGALTQAYVGKNAVGASYEAATAGRVVAKKVTIATDCLMTDIEVHIKQVADVAATQLFTFLFDDNGSGTAPKHLLGSWGTVRDMVLEATSAGPRDPRWVGIACGKWLTAGDWWIAWQLFDPDFNIAYDTGGSDPYMTPTNPQIGDWGLWTPTNSTRDYSIRANTIR